MISTISWARSIGGRIAILVAAMLVVVLATLATGVRALNGLRDLTELAVDHVGYARVVSFERSMVVAGVLVLVVLVLLWLTMRSVHLRLRQMATTAKRIAAGETELSASVPGSDEVWALGRSFDDMTTHLRRRIDAEHLARERLTTLLEATRETVARLASSASEILAATRQQGAGLQRQASTVEQTATTVAEVARTADQTAERARGVAEAVRRSEEVGQAGRRAVDEAVTVVAGARQQVDKVALAIVALAEQSTTIGEIIGMVNDLADQTNLLALNAAIEAARAGEHGRGFSVVASEVRALSDRSKRATERVRQILGEIQKLAGGAATAGEQGSRGMIEASRSVANAGQTINALTLVISSVAQAAAQIVASAAQQAIGLSQVDGAMKDIDQVMHQHLAATRQTEQAALVLRDEGERLKLLVDAPAGPPV